MVLAQPIRERDWYSNGDRVAELSIAVGLPDLIDPQTTGEQSLTITEVAGADALAVEDAGFGGPPISLVMWSPQPEVVVDFGMHAPIDEALRVARSLDPVDVATWPHARRTPVDAPDGCSSFRC